MLQPAPDLVFVLQSAGNLATTQEVLDRIQQDLETPGDDHESLATVTRMCQAALYIGRLGREVSQRHFQALSAVGADGTATVILGGQIEGSEADILLVYPEGNYIGASDERPFLQIGESKYGKLMLEIAVAADAGLVAATKIALGSIMSPAHANLSVGPPYDLGAYRNNSLSIDEFRITEDSLLLARLKDLWQTHILAALKELPSVADFEELAARPRIQSV